MSVQILQGDCIEIMRKLPPESVNCVVTSPPYWGLRSYGIGTENGELGLEPTPEAYVANMVAVFREARRVLRDDGTLWLNLGDSYAANGGAHGGRLDNQRGVGAKRTHESGGGDQGQRRAPGGLKPKDLIGIPWRVAFALQADGWYLRSDIIWHKPNPMPESVTDRPTKAHEYLFMLSKAERYYYDSNAIAEPAKYGDNGSSFESEYDSATKPGLGHKRRVTVARGGFNGKTNAIPGREAFRAIKDTRNKRSVWTVPTQPYRESHFATFPPALITPCILAGCPVGGTVLDPFGGSGTTGMVAELNGRNSILIELNPAYIEMAKRRTAQQRLKL